MQMPNMWNVFGPDSNRACIWTWRSHKWNAPFHLCLCGSAKQHRPIKKPRCSQVYQYMSINKDSHANTARQDQSESGNRNPSYSSRVHHVHHHQDPIITEIHQTYINRIIIQHTSIIQHQFNLILTVSNESSRESFINQTSIQHNYFNTAWNQ